MRQRIDPGASLQGTNPPVLSVYGWAMSYLRVTEKDAGQGKLIVNEGRITGFNLTGPESRTHVGEHVFGKPARSVPPWQDLRPNGSCSAGHVVSQKP